MLLPMNYAVLIGGMATTIGTSTNLIVVALAVSLGVGPFSLFGFYSLVAVAALPALAYLWLVAPRMLAHVNPPTEKLSEKVFDAEIHVEAGSWLEGQHLRETFEATGHRLRLLDLRRRLGSISRLPSITLRQGDQLVVQDSAANLKEFEANLHATLHGVDMRAATDKQPAAEDEIKPPPTSAVVAQMVVTPTSALAGRNVRSERIAERFGVLVVGLRPRKMLQGWKRENLIDREVNEGDVQREGFGLLLDSSYTLPRQDKAGVATIAMAAVVLLAATKILPISLAALDGVIFLLAMRCLSWQDVTQSLSVKVILEGCHRPRSSPCSNKC